MIDQADRLGLEMGISAASSWNAGGPWICPGDACQTLAWEKLQLTGPKKVTTDLPLPDKAKTPTTTLAVIAVPDGATVIDQAIRLDD